MGRFLMIIVILINGCQTIDDNFSGENPYADYKIPQHLIDLHNFRVSIYGITSTMKYTKDIDYYGVKDYWQKPEETLRLWQGDCEDYAILEMAAWYSLWSEKGMIVILYNYKTTTCHALFCITKSNGKIFIPIQKQYLDDYMCKTGYSIWSTVKYETAMYMAFVVKTPRMIKGNY